MRSAPFFSKDRFDPFLSKGKAAAAALVLLLMVAFLSLYRSNLCLIRDEVKVSEDPPQATVGPDSRTTMSEDPLVELSSAPPLAPEMEVQRALTEQARILEKISKDVDSVNQSLDEIQAFLQEEAR